MWHSIIASATMVRLLNAGYSHVNIMSGWSWYLALCQDCQDILVKKAKKSIKLRYHGISGYSKLISPFPSKNIFNSKLICWRAQILDEIWKGIWCVLQEELFLQISRYDYIKPQEMNKKWQTLVAKTWKWWFSSKKVLSEANS